MKYFETIRHLRPVQIYGRIWFRLRRPRVGDVTAGPLRKGAGPWIPPIARATARVAPSRFRFLNEEREIRGWNDPGIPKLWLYNLHYFDCPDADLIARWIRENPPRRGNGWEPYPLSRRIVNWLKWGLSGNPWPEGVESSLAAQAEYLSQRVEYHLLANHLFVNGKALLYAGICLGVERWARQGLTILTREIPEQILDDGGHFELSPLYHSLILEDILDLVNLAGHYPGELPDWSPAAGKMLGWLQQMTHPDGEIAFFNDAAFGVAPAFAQLRDYAARLGAPWQPATLGCGYWRLEGREPGTVVLFDAAALGPNYQPGHAHADTLSFEMSHRGRRIVVNSGTSTYEAGPLRQSQRGTAAHSTVRVDGEDSSEVWGGFRVARRARVRDVEADSNRVGAAHDGYLRLVSPVLHRRTLTLTENFLKISDLLNGGGCHSAEVRYHLHPAVVCGRKGTHEFELSAGQQPLAVLQMDEKCKTAIETGRYFPEFGREEKTSVIVGRWTGECPVSLTTCFHLSAER